MSESAHVENDDLTLPICAQCGAWLIAGRAFCHLHPSAAVGSRRLSGRGTVYSCTVSHVAMSTDLGDRVPYTTVLVETAEGPRLLAHAEPGATLTIGMDVVLSIADADAALPGAGRRVARPA